MGRLNDQLVYVREKFPEKINLDYLDYCKKLFSVPTGISPREARKQANQLSKTYVRKNSKKETEGLI